MSAKRARESVNILNDNESEQGYGYQDNTLITVSGSEYYENGWVFTTEYISVQSGKEYGIFTSLFRATAENRNVVKYYYIEETNVTYIGYSTLNKHAALSEKEYSKSEFSLFTVPSGANAIRVSIDVLSTQNIICLANKIPDIYEPCGATIWEDCTVKRYHNDAWIDAEEYVRHNGAWDEQ